MMEHLNPESGSGRRSEQQTSETRSQQTDSVVDDQITGIPGHPADAVHAWLDGESSATAAQRADATDAELWARISEETARRGRMKTPAPVMNRLMASIPEHAPLAAQPWWKRTVELGVPALAAAGAGLLAVGALLGAALG
jgi:hypothetical protein